jgi:hypothetical protein
MNPSTAPSSGNWRAWPDADKARLLAELRRRAYRRDPARLLSDAGVSPDPWQAAALASPATRQLFLCSRQAGKSLTAAALALREALSDAPALVLLLSPTLRQSGELFREKLLPLYDALGRPVPRRRQTQLELVLANGSRVVSLPENEAGVRGFSSVNLLVIDEGSRVDDGLYRAVRPMLAVSGGALVALSTPWGQRGWFFDEWTEGHGWERYSVTAEQCPRISAEFLAEERIALGERWHEQEYRCVFSDAVDALFSADVIRKAMQGEVKPLFSLPGSVE